MKTIIAYVPVLHEGYRALFEKHQGAELFLIGPEQVGEDFPKLGRDLRQLPVAAMRDALAALGLLKDVQVYGEGVAAQLNAAKASVVMPVDEISERIAVQLPDCSIAYENVFLRWDKPVTLAEKEVRPDCAISTEAVDRQFIQRAAKEAEKSADWWRQVGAVVVRDVEVLFVAYNAHHPSEQAVLAAGNPRDNFDAGEHLEISDTLHGEASVVAQAARAGVSLAGTSVYVTTFPCINCARLLAEAGVKKVYYRDGYSRLDAEGVLKDNGVELILIQ